MNSKLRIIASVVSPLLVAGTITVLGPVASASAATCFGSSCTGKDPQASGCSDVNTKTLDHISLSTYGSDYVELRYSPTCHAAWVKTVGSSTVQGVIYGENWDSSLLDYVVKCTKITSWNSGTNWSAMCGGYTTYEISGAIN
jgi:hypothetical protein